ncbi:NUDIX domain-containing protein [Candidatus Bathyarchaeota archaeon]|nr:NUDIX domain-containing protein [Candidatus Bathyarchaeota archaeon]MBS7617049.1 NUDIX domain-containing protein [Candidatus Bathyarchaeota archaeon]
MVSNCREYPTRPVVAVSVLIKSGSKVLLIKRRFNPGSGKWSIPGGLIELGETIREAALREVYEETGLTVNLDKLLNVVDYIEVDERGVIRFHYVLICLSAYINCALSIKPSEEVADFIWVEESAVLNYDITDSLRKLLSGK